MNVRRALIVALAVVLVAPLHAETPAAAPRLAILSEPAADAEAALLTVELGKQPVVLLERAEVARILAEQRLSLAGLAPAQLAGVGKLLHADGVVFLGKDGPADRQALALRCVAVHPGVVIESWREQAPAEAVQWSRETAARFASLLPKLTVRAEAAVPVSVLNLRVTRARPEAAELERELTVLLTHRLAHEPALFVLERQQMAALAQEKEGEAAAPFWTGRWLIDGSIEQALSDPDALTIVARLHAPGGGEAATVRHTCRRGELTEAAEALAQGIARALKQEPMREPWEAGVEAEQFWREAQWAFQNGLHRPAARAAEASWALGRRRAEVIALRARAELFWARPNEVVWMPYPNQVVRDFLFTQTWHWRARLPSMSGLRTPREMQKVYRDMAEPEREERLRSALRGVELARDHFDLITADPLLVNQALLIGAAMLEWFADNRGGAFDDGMHALQSALRELAALGPGKAARRDRAAAEFWQLKATFAPELARTPAETLAIYREALAQRFGPDGDAKLRVALAHSRDLRPALVLEQPAETPDAAELWGTLLVDLAVSDFPGDRLLSAFGRTALTTETWRDPLAPALAEAFWQERARFATGELPFDYVNFLGLPQASHARGPEPGRIGPTEAAKFDFARRFLLYLLSESPYVDMKVFSDLYHPDVYTEEEAREMYRAILAHDARVRQMRGDDVFLRYVRERSQELRLRFPQLVGAPPDTAALKATRYWHPYRLPGFDGSIKRADPNIYTGAYAEGRLWFCSGFDQPGLNKPYADKPYHIFAVDLKTFETEVINCPAPPPPGEPHKPSFDGNYLTVTPEALYVSHATQLARYDRRAGTWRYYPELTNVFSRPWLIGGRLYVRTDNTKGDQAYHMGDVVELDLATGVSTVISSDRRHPPEAPLDSWPFGRVTVLAGPEGKVFFHGIPENRSGPRSAAYDPAARQWAALEESAWKQAAGEEPEEWRVVARAEDPGRLTLVRGARQVEFRCELPAEDRVLLAKNGPSPTLGEIERNLGHGSAPYCRNTPDGLAITTGGWVPGFWFVPNADLERAAPQRTSK